MQQSPEAGHSSPTQNHWLKQLLELLLSALFVASAVHVLEPLISPIEMPMRLLASHRVAYDLAQARAQQPLEGPPEFAILKLDQDTFRGVYNGRQPLDRCLLCQHLPQILALPRLRELGIDLDLSPVGEDRQDACGQALLEDLAEAQKNNPSLRITLILPIDAHERERFKDWRLGVGKLGLHMADPAVLGELGLVRRHGLYANACPSLGVAMNLSALDPHSPKPDPESCFRCELPATPDSPDPHSARNISFHRLVDAWVAAPDTPLLPESAASAGGSQLEQLTRAGGATRVIFGADFDHSDAFLTPLGTLSGLEVHAAVAMNPDEPVSHRWAFALDIGLGVVFGWVVKQFWTAYFRQRLGAHGHASQDAQRLAYLWLVGLLLLWGGAALMALPWFSIWVLKNWELWINPVPMLVGMSVDAFVLGSVHVALHQAGHAQTEGGPRAMHPREHFATPRISAWRLHRAWRRPKPGAIADTGRPWPLQALVELLAWAPMLVWLTVVSWVLFGLFVH